jgi:hypothetical protein
MILELLKILRGPGAFVQFLTWGRPDFVLPAATIVLTEPAPIRGSNSRLRSGLARNCDGRIFEFFNSIGGEDNSRPTAALE